MERKINKIHLNKNKKELIASKGEINLITKYLKSGKVLVYPTDTIYGLGCLATDKRAIDKVYKIKKRSGKKPLLILVSSLAMLRKYCYVSVKQRDFLKKVWPGPVTVILRGKGILPANLSGGSKDIAARLPKNKILIKIIREAKAPLVSTSLNISGKENLTEIGAIEKYFKKNKPDLVIDGGGLRGKPSKLMDLRDFNNIKVIRR